MNINENDIYEYYIVQNHRRIETAKYFNISESSIKKICSKNKWYKNKEESNKLISESHKISIDIDLLRKMYIDENQPRRVICDYFNISETAFKRIVKENNIKKSLDKILYNTNKTLQNNLGINNVSELYTNSQIREKAKQTNLMRYGCENPVQNEDIKNKIIQTNLERYGFSNPFQNRDVQNKIQETNLDKYGYKTPAKNSLVNKKIQQTINKTNLERYGCLRPLQNDLIKSKVKETNLKRYGAINPSQNKDILGKIYATKNKNNSWQISKPEDKLYEKLINKYGEEDVIRQYRDERYPFNCDFYIISQDLFIELNLSWTHGGHPFDINNQDDINKLQIWKDKNTEYYDNAIETWTIRDLLKLKTARDNKLNYVVYYKEEEISI